MHVDANSNEASPQDADNQNTSADVVEAHVADDADEIDERGGQEVLDDTQQNDRLPCPRRIGTL